MWRRAGGYVLTWEDVGICGKRVAESVIQSGFRPTIICPVVRGGLILAAYLATVLDVPRQRSVRVRRTVEDSSYAGKQPPVLTTPEPLGITASDRVLVVEDIVGSGETGQLLRKYFEGLGPAAVRVATITCNHVSAFVPDYLGVVVDDWVYFPWEDNWAEASKTAARVPLDRRELSH